MIGRNLGGGEHDAAACKFSISSFFNLTSARLKQRLTPLSLAPIKLDLRAAKRQEKAEKEGTLTENVDVN